ncbi:uncharacterized protein LOC120215440 [Hibiscus syriacus]|nr:uncharacterized protein LOC120215440 [Hibiscus syriacus]
MDVLTLAWGSGARGFEAETDNSEAVRILKAPSQPNEVAIVRRIHALMSLQWEVNLFYVGRERNSLTDYLASLGRFENPGIHVLTNPPPRVHEFLEKDLLTRVSR